MMKNRRSLHNKTEKKALRSGVLFLLLLLCSLTFWGCGKAQTEYSTQSSEDNMGMSNISVYYVLPDWSGYCIDRLEIDQFDTTENMIDKTINSLIYVEEGSDCAVPIPSGITYQRYNYDGHGIINIVFNVDYLTTESSQIVMCKRAFVDTLTQINGVSRITFEMVDLINEKAVVEDTFDSKSFYSPDENIMKSTQDIFIYLPNEQGDKLRKQECTIDFLNYDFPEKQILDELKAQGQDYMGSIDTEVVVNSVYIENETCYVDFSKEFLNVNTFVDSSVIFYSIVNSLCELDEVNQVAISVEGDTTALFGDKFDLSNPYLPDYYICE